MHPKSLSRNEKYRDARQVIKGIGESELLKDQGYLPDR
jgi:hypothetical protein